MAKVFLDANALIDFITPRSNLNLDNFLEHTIFLSPISIHILFYTQKYKVPRKDFDKIINRCEIVNLSREIAHKSLIGPTQDFEDNVQLQSAVEAKVEYFLTSDRKLLTLGVFGKTEIVSSLQTN